MPLFIEPTAHDEDARTIQGTISVMENDVACIFEYEYNHMNSDYRIISAKEIGRDNELVGLFTFSNDMFAPIEEEIKQMIETAEEEAKQLEIDSYDEEEQPGHGHAGSVAE